MTRAVSMIHLPFAYVNVLEGRGSGRDGSSMTVAPGAICPNEKLPYSRPAGSKDIVTRTSKESTLPTFVRNQLSSGMPLELSCRRLSSRKYASVSSRFRRAVSNACHPENAAAATATATATPLRNRLHVASMRPSVMEGASW